MSRLPDSKNLQTPGRRKGNANLLNLGSDTNMTRNTILNNKYNSFKKAYNFSETLDPLQITQSQDIEHHGVSFADTMVVDTKRQYAQLQKLNLQKQSTEPNAAGEKGVDAKLGMFQNDFQATFENTEVKDAGVTER